jgi:malonate decarboxylase gamma subunit
MSGQVGLRGKAWFQALTGQTSAMKGDPGSVLAADAGLGEDNARFLCVAPNAQARFPCARRGEVGLEEAYTLAARVREVIGRDSGPKKTPIVAIVDVKSQAHHARRRSSYIRRLPDTRLPSQPHSRFRRLRRCDPRHAQGSSGQDHTSIGRGT